MIRRHATEQLGREVERNPRLQLRQLVSMGVDHDLRGRPCAGLRSDTHLACGVGLALARAERSDHIEIFSSIDNTVVVGATQVALADDSVGKRGRVPGNDPASLGKALAPFGQDMRFAHQNDMIGAGDIEVVALARQGFPRAVDESIDPGTGSAEQPACVEVEPGGSRSLDLEPAGPALGDPVQLAAMDRLVAGVAYEVIGGKLDGTAATPRVGPQGGTFSAGLRT